MASGHLRDGTGVKLHGVSIDGDGVHGIDGQIMAGQNHRVASDGNASDDRWPAERRDLVQEARARRPQKAGQKTQTATLARDIALLPTCSPSRDHGPALVGTCECACATAGGGVGKSRFSTTVSA
jgi:hypothetical protein